MATIYKKQVLWHILILTMILITLLAEFAYLSQAPELVDEGANWKQIKIFLNRELYIKLGLNVIPGYHAIIAAVMILFSKSGMYTARFVTTLVSFASIIVFYMITWKICLRPSIVKTLQYSLFPIFLPFFPLVYTDILAILMILSGVLLHPLEKIYALRSHPLLSVLVRTNNIIWFAFLVRVHLLRKLRVSLKAFVKSLTLTWCLLFRFWIVRLIFFY